jgi:hypothetical protein
MKPLLLSLLLLLPSGLMAQLQTGGGALQTQTLTVLASANLAKANLTATTDPGVSNDSTQGYAVGSTWLNTTLSRQWTCTSAAVGAAVWTGTFNAAGVSAFGYGIQGDTTPPLHGLGLNATTGFVGWATGASNWDTSISRCPGVTGCVAFGTGAAGDTSGQLIATKIQLGDGTAGSPAWQFANSTSLGFFRVSGTTAFGISGNLQFGGAAASFPLIKRVGNALAIRQADDTVGTFSTLTACAAGLEGAMAPVTDSTTVTWGATITGSGANHVLAYCDGTNWTVLGK